MIKRKSCIWRCGKAQDILRFMQNELESTATHIKKGIIDIEPPVVNVDEYGFCICKSKNLTTENGYAFATLHIKDTRREFIDGDINVEFEEPNEKITICIDGFKAAWAVDADPYVAKAKKYGIDIKIVVFERGQEFMQIVEIVKGKLLRDNATQFDDWNWKSPMPNMGG